MTALKVLETNIIHAGDVIYWLDGSTAEEPSAMTRVPRPLAIEWTSRPADLQVLNSIGKTALWRKPLAAMVPGRASDIDKALPVTPAFTVAGTVYDPQGGYNPRAFALTAGNAVGHALALYPSPLGVHFGKSGGLKGHLLWEDPQAPVSWALLTLEVTTAIGATMIFRAQSDRHGDFLLAMNRLPPLPGSIDHYDAELRLDASPSADPDAGVDVDHLVAMTLGEPASANTFAASISLQLIPGEVKAIQSFGKKYLAVKPSPP
jgi:hypothetical protein